MVLFWAFFLSHRICVAGILDIFQSCSPKHVNNIRVVQQCVFYIFAVDYFQSAKCFVSSCSCKGLDFCQVSNTILH